MGVVTSISTAYDIGLDLVFTDYSNQSNYYLPLMGFVMSRIVLLRRSIVKAVTYRILIMCMDFATIYIFTGALRVAIGFVIVSNIYTSVAYFVHERIWARFNWGINGR